MLVLSRKVGEAIRIDDEVSIVFLGAKGKQAQIGVCAPRKVIVHREEVYQKILEEAVEAMTEKVVG